VAARRRGAICRGFPQCDDFAAQDAAGAAPHIRAHDITGQRARDENRPIFGAVDAVALGAECMNGKIAEHG
jgi:hypothetical protein